MLLTDRIEANEKEKQELMKLVRQSKFWNAIENFIKNSRINECGLIDKKGPLHYPYLTGSDEQMHLKSLVNQLGTESYFMTGQLPKQCTRSVYSEPFRIKEVYPYPLEAYPYHESTFRFCFDVLMEVDDTIVEECCILDVPIALLNEFDQNLFDEWVAQKDKESREKNLESARKKIEKIFSRYPELRNI